MMKVAVLDDYLHLAEDAANWNSLDAEVSFFYDTILDEDALVARLLPFDVLVTTRERTRLPESVLTRLTNLKFIAGTGGRQGHIDLDLATKLGIPVCGTRGAGARGNATAELTWALVLATMRHLVWEDKQVRQGHWNTRVAESVGGKTLGILGLGRIGSVVAKFGQVFEMDVIAWGPTLDAERAGKQGVEYVSWDDLFSRSDVLSIHVPLSDLSRGWVTEREFGLMKQTAFLINTSRGPIVKEKALLHALQNGDIAGAGLDVYDVEPLPKDHPFINLENVVLSPHLGYSTGTALKQFYIGSVENVQAWLNGKPTNVLNEDVLA